MIIHIVMNITTVKMAKFESIISATTASSIIT